jgi:hypothetical protein
MKMEDLHDGAIIWFTKSVLNMSVIDTLLRAPQGTTMSVLMHKIVDLKYIIWSIKSVPNMIVVDTLLQAPQGATSDMPSHMSHHLGMLRIVIDTHHHMIVVDHHHLMDPIDTCHHVIFTDTSHSMSAIDKHLPRIFDDTTQAMVMMPEDESLDMKTTTATIRCLPLRGWQVHIVHTFLIRRLPPLVPPPQWPLPRHMPMDSDATSASNKATLHGNVPISYVRCARPRVMRHGNAQRQAPRRSTSTSYKPKPPRSLRRPHFKMKITKVNSRMLWIRA